MKNENSTGRGGVVLIPRELGQSSTRSAGFGVRQSGEGMDADGSIKVSARSPHLVEHVLDRDAMIRA